MQIVIEVADTKANFVLELLSSLPFVAIQKEVAAMDRHETTELSPKTAQLLGAFSQVTDDETLSRQKAILTKHA